MPCNPTLAVTERRVAAMGSQCHLIATGGTGELAAVLDAAEQRLAELEARWSRFRPGSEISRLNTGNGAAMPVSDETLELIGRAVEAAERTGGIFDPTMLRCLEATGYDRTFVSIDASGLYLGEIYLGGIDLGEIDLGGIDLQPGCGGIELQPGCGGIELDLIAGTAQLPPDVAFDPGGLGKGLAADLLVEQMLAAGADGALANLGGDIACAGAPPNGRAWTIAAGERIAGVELEWIDLAKGGVATSTSRRRRWSTPSGEVHHLLDPATGRSSDAAAMSVTVIAASACDAETLATALAVVGDTPAEPHMLGNAAALLHTADGRRVALGPVEDFLR